MRNAFQTLILGVALCGLLSPAGQASFFEKKIMVNGAGATFPYPLYSKWFSEYQKLKPGFAFNYQSIGSGGGIRQLLDQTVDFGASDAPMSDEQLKKAKALVIHVPATLGAVVLSYHFPAYSEPLKLTGAIIAEIFLGRITKWDDPKLLVLNPGLRGLSSDGTNNDILVVHRADGSGTTSIFSDFLSKSSPDWKSKVGKGTALRWPVGIGGKGNEGVSSFIQQIPGSIGFVELVFAETLHLKTATIENPLHEFVKPSTETVTAAATGALPFIPPDFRTSLTLINAPHAYPISSFSYILVYPSMPVSPKRTALFEFLNWALTTGQSYSARLNYAPLPESLVKKVLLQVNLP